MNENIHQEYQLLLIMNIICHNNIKYVKICVILGTRPELIKMQPIINEIINKNHDLLFIHTSQHYDLMMSDIFLKELQIKQPNYFLNVETSSQGLQTGQIISSSETLFLKEMPDIILVQGDTNSALGSAIAASKINLPIGHVEAGCRSFDRRMPEEINRVLISDIASFNFAPTNNCVLNLKREGIRPDTIFLTGHPIVDLLSNLNLNDLSKINNANDLEKKSYYLLTIHRRENIENEKKIVDIFNALDKISQNMTIIFPCHPHTKRQIIKYNIKKYLKNIQVIDAVGYFDSLSLIKHSRIVITDSGGIQQESAILGTPCITLRDVTEWIETVNSGTNILVGSKRKSILDAVQNIEDNYIAMNDKIKNIRNLFGTPGSSKRIIEIIEKNF